MHLCMPMYILCTYICGKKSFRNEKIKRPKLAYLESKMMEQDDKPDKSEP